MGVESAYPVTFSAVTVRAAYFEEEQLMCLPKNGGKPRKSLGRRSKLVQVGPKHDVQQRYIRRSVREQLIRSHLFDANL